MVIIGHQYKIADQIRQAQLDTGGIDALENLLRVIILVQLNVGTNQAIHTLVYHLDGIFGVLCEEGSDQIHKQRIVMVNDTVLTPVHLIQLASHKKLKLVVIRFNGLELQLALVVKAVPLEFILIVEVLFQFCSITFVGRRVGQSLDQDVQGRKPLLAINDDVAVDMLLGRQRSIDEGTTEMLPILLKSQDDVLKELLTLLRGPGIVSLKDRNAVLLFIRLNVVIQHSAAFDSHTTFTPFFLDSDAVRSCHSSSPAVQDIP